MVGLEFLIHKFLGRELNKIKVNIESVDLEEYEKNRRKGVLSKLSDKYLCYFIDCIYNLSQKDQYFSDIFFIFLGSLILNQSKNCIVSDGFKILTIKSFVENYKEWGNDDRFAFSEEQLLNMLLSIFQQNKDLMMNDKGFAMELKSSGNSLQIIACILTGDMKSTFVQY